LKYIDEYRDKKLVMNLVKAITESLSREWTLMEICGGQTHSIMKYKLQDLLPAEIKLIHGPGCPVCVTPVELIDQAVELAGKPDVILVSFGDMLRVPGTKEDLLSIKARGGDVRMVYSPLDSLTLAESFPEKEVVFFGVGFETTAPAVALAIKEAHRRKLSNFSVLVSHVLVPPAIDALLQSPENHIHGFLAAGHVCTIMGTAEYESLVRKYKIPMVVTGFEPVDILQGISLCIKMLEEGRAGLGNAYSRSVRAEGNVEARKLLEEIYRPVDRQWRGIGNIPSSGLGLSESYQDYDAAKRFDLGSQESTESEICQAGKVLTGLLLPTECEAFGSLCTPEKPLGAPMVSSEGACAAYYRYR